MARSFIWIQYVNSSSLNNFSFKCNFQRINIYFFIFITFDIRVERWEKGFCRNQRPSRNPYWNWINV